ncbi:MAG: hypothetical protein HYZ18_15955 [Pseudogulbenkiania sp.]|nr:hypothetical protein [Pseudogulbenkiania sp.]
MGNLVEHAHLLNALDKSIFHANKIDMGKPLKFIDIDRRPSHRQRRPAGKAAIVAALPADMENATRRWRRKRA